MVYSKLLVVLALTGGLSTSALAWRKVATKVTTKVTIIERQRTQTSYARDTPGSSTFTTVGDAGCGGYLGVANCTTTSTTRQVNTPARHMDYEVQGATLSLLLPDGRVVVVNCSSKYSPRADPIHRRSCRIPVANQIEAVFEGDQAKLMWPVSLDGSKAESEMYKILGIRNPD